MGLFTQLLRKVQGNDAKEDTRLSKYLSKKISKKINKILFQEAFHERKTVRLCALAQFRTTNLIEFLSSGVDCCIYRHKNAQLYEALETHFPEPGLINIVLGYHLHHESSGSLQLKFEYKSTRMRTSLLTPELYLPRPGCINATVVVDQYNERDIVQRRRMCEKSYVLNLLSIQSSSNQCWNNFNVKTGHVLEEANIVALFIDCSAFSTLAEFVASVQDQMESMIARLCEYISEDNLVQITVAFINADSLKKLVQKLAVPIQSVFFAKAYLQYRVNRYNGTQSLRENLTRILYEDYLVFDHNLTDFTVLYFDKHDTVDMGEFISQQSVFRLADVLRDRMYSFYDNEVDV